MSKDEFASHLKSLGYICEMAGGIPTVYSEDKAVTKHIIQAAKDCGYNSSYGISFRREAE